MGLKRIVHYHPTYCTLYVLTCSEWYVSLLKGYGEVHRNRINSALFFIYLLIASAVKCLHLSVNLLNAELNPICHLLALLGVHFLHVSRIRVKSLTLRLLMSYIYIWSTYS